MVAVKLRAQLSIWREKLQNIMDDEDVLYLDNIEEFINDEDRIVTYKWLSRTLHVPSNTAKQMLYTYLTKKQQDKNGNSISATYIVGGRCSVDGQMMQQFVLTNDENLEDTKSCFDVITSVHIYSLQKCKIKDTNALYTVDYNIRQDHKDDTERWNHIYCKDAKPFEDGGASRAKGKSKPGKENHEPASTSKTIVNGQGISKQMTNSQKPKVSNQKPKKGQLPNMGMFAAKNEKPASVEKEQEEEKKPKTIEEKKSSKTTKPSGSMLSFFGKQVSGQQKSTDKKEEKPKSKTPEKEVKQTENKQDNDRDRDKIKEKSPKKGKEAKTGDTGKSSKSVDKEKETLSETISKETKKTNKQSRKRIKNLDSSDDDEEPIPKKLNKLVSDTESTSEDDSKAKTSKRKKKNDAEEEDTKTKKRTNKKEKKTSEKQSQQDEHEEKPTNTNRKRKKETKSVSSEEVSPIRPKSNNKAVVSETPVANQHSTGNPTKRRKRRKVMRSKTYVDDDGFMVTEKVYESESTDASDEEVIPVRQEQPQQAKKTSPDSKPKKVTELKPVKQASLMSFFKKS